MSSGAPFERSNEYMDNIHIKRYTEHPQVQGCIEPEDKRWQLLIDHEGYPHLIVRVHAEGDDGQIIEGLMAVDDLLPDGLTIKQVMTETFGGKLSPEEEAEFASTFVSSAPCPVR